MPESSLHRILAAVRRRLLGISLGSGLAWGMVAAVLALVACAWVDLAMDLAPTVRLACLFGAMVLGVMLLTWAVIAALRQGHGPSLARKLDRAGGTGGQILAGVDLAQQYSSKTNGTGDLGAMGCGTPLPVAARSNTTGSGVPQPMAPGSASALSVQPAISLALARMAIDRAAQLAAGVRAAAAVPLKPLYWPAALAACIAIALLVLALSAPRLMSTQWARFTDPFGDHPPYSAIQFDVSPGDTRVLYGAALDVRVTSAGGPVEQLDLVLLPADGSTAGEQVLPMFPEPGGAWRATVAEVTAPGKYLVRTRGARSRQFGYELITVPEVREVTFVVTPPAYTHKPPYKGPMPQGGISGLPGTIVEAVVKSNRPLSGGMARFVPAQELSAPSSRPTTGPSGGAAEPPASAGGYSAGSSGASGGSAIPAPVPITMTPVAPGASEAKLSFTMDRAGKLEIGVTDVSGQSSKEPVVVPLHLLHDDRPFVRIMEPRPQSYATPDVVLNVQVLAEDDYGVSRVQVFRSLNDSRPRAIDAPVPPTQPKRLPVTVPLKLADYGLKPGDTIRLFARVEDTDPSGPNGSESSIVTVQIISKEELNRMTMARQGLETLQSKYEEARRRLEALDNDIRKKQEELSKVPPESELAKEKQKELDGLAQKVLDTADAIADIAGEDLPLDIDRALRKGLYEMANDVRKAGNSFFHEAGQLGLSAGQAKKATDKLREDLGLQKKKLEEKATEPLDFLAKVFPLKEDEARFMDLAARQRDLADRMQSLQGQTGDDPKMKARLRDLEQEQRQLREELRDLLQDIDNHVAGLPDDPRVDDLRKTAQKFASDVRASDAEQQMNSSETNLSEFKAVEAAKQAKDAADTLEKFVGRCKSKGSMGDEAGMCLKFHPSLSECIGDTAQQLLDMEGLGQKPGMGTGNGQGYSARRNTLKNVGLYGSLPKMSKSSKQSGGHAQQAGGASSEGQTPDSEDPFGSDSTGKMKATGASDTIVPPRYKRKVGEYFQRLADELGD